MKVQLTYFKDTGKFYGKGEYETDKDTLHEIWDEVREMIKQGTRPGLVKGCHEFHTHVNVPGHRHEHPRLMLGTKSRCECANHQGGQCSFCAEAKYEL